VAQLNTITVGGTAANGQVYTVTINGKTVTYTANGTDTNTTIATALQTNLANSTIGEFTEETWANPSAGVITATANTAGMPFTQTSSATGTGTLVTVVTTASSGPSDVSVAANWSTGATPANGDNVYIANSSVGLLYNLQALSAINPASITWDTTFTGNCGLPTVNPNGYQEYRQQYWQIGATLETFVPGTGGGSPLIKRDNGSVAWTVNVESSGSPAIQGRPAIILKGTSASNVLTVTSGNAGSAVDPGEVSTWQTINISYQNSQQTDVTMLLGSGCTLTTINQDGGTLTVNSSITTFTMRGGTSTVFGTGTIGTLDVEIGTCSYQSNGTITTATVGVSGTLDFSKDPRTRTCTNCTVYGTLNDPNQTVTFTNPVYFPNGVNASGATLNYGTNYHLARS
jgi:hypothetical protein